MLFTLANTRARTEVLRDAITPKINITAMNSALCAYKTRLIPSGIVQENKHKVLLVFAQGGRVAPLTHCQN